MRFLFAPLCMLILSCTTAGKQPALLADLGNEYCLLADFCAETGKHDKALELYQKALQAGIKNERALMFKIGRNAALAKKWDIALKEYTALLKIDENNVLIKKSIAWIYGQKGDWDKAEYEYEVLYVARPYDNDVCVNYILVLHALKKDEKARSIFSAYAEIYPDAPNIAELEKLFTKAESE